MHKARKPFGGRQMAAIFVTGFGIVIAVNVAMASLAVESFHGTVVDNSYVASQSYNGWLGKAAASKALGWLFFGDFPDGYTFVGVAILISCATYITMRERSTGRSSRRGSSTQRRAIQTAPIPCRTW